MSLINWEIVVSVMAGLFFWDMAKALAQLIIGGLAVAGARLFAHMSRRS